MRNYFEKEGKKNTDETVKIALQRAAELGIKKVVVASYTGTTAIVVLVAASGKGIEVIVVGHLYGLREPDANHMNDEMQEKIRKACGRGRILPASSSPLVQLLPGTAKRG